MPCSPNFKLNGSQDMLKLSDETDLDVLNHMMEVIVEAYSKELLPVASQLTARLVRSSEFHDRTNSNALFSVNPTLG